MKKKKVLIQRKSAVAVGEKTSTIVCTNSLIQFNSFMWLALEHFSSEKLSKQWKNPIFPPLP